MGFDNELVRLRKTEECVFGIAEDTVRITTHALQRHLTVVGM